MKEIGWDSAGNCMWCGEAGRCRCNHRPPKQQGISTAGLQLGLERLSIVMAKGERNKNIMLAAIEGDSPEFQQTCKDLRAINRYVSLKEMSALQRRRCLDAIDRMCEYIQDVLEREE